MKERSCAANRSRCPPFRSSGTQSLLVHVISSLASIQARRMWSGATPRTSIGEGNFETLVRRHVDHRTHVGGIKPRGHTNQGSRKGRRHIEIKIDLSAQERSAGQTERSSQATSLSLPHHRLSYRPSSPSPFQHLPLSPPSAIPSKIPFYST